MKPRPAISLPSPAWLLAALLWLLPGCKSDIDPARLENLRDDLDAVITGERGAPPPEDAARGGWDTEVFGARAQETLEAFAHLLDSPPGKTPADGLLAEEFTSSALRPAGLEETFRDRHFIVRKAPAGKQAASRKGRGGLEAALGELLEAFAGSTGRHSKLKLFEVALGDGNSARTRTYFQLGGRFEEGTFQVKATWLSNWTRAGERWLLKSTEVESYEEAIGLTGAEPLFTDCTKASLAGNAAFRSQLLPGLDHWMGRIELRMGIDIGGWQGLAIGDIDGDGRDDLYVCQPGGLPNRLFVQNTDGTVTERSAELGVDWLDNTASALFVDLDNDGDQDLVLATFEGTQVLENNTGRGFRPVARLASADYDLHALSAADYDGDGDLDLYVTVDFAVSPGRPFLYHDANDGGRNQLFRNDGAWRFVDATEQAGLGLNNARHSLAAAWEDYDNDGDQDLYIANDYGKNCLYRNDGGRFSEIAERAGTVDYGSGMSVSWADYDRDGWMDLYVGNMFSSAGSRITSQDNFLAKSGQPVRSLYRRFVRGNSCFRNERDGTFAEMSEKSGAMVAGWAWSSVFTDLDNDGWEDLFVANGYITTPDTGDL